MVDLRKSGRQLAKAMKQDHPSPLVTVLVFVVAGTLLVLMIHAAVIGVAVEPESGAATAGATAQSDSQASGGKYVKFGAPTPPPPPPPANTFYLATNGSDSNDGSLARPWRTFNASLMKLKPSYTLMVRGGTYTENVNVTDVPDGTASSKITLESYPGETPVITNQVLIGSPSHWVISGINVHWTSGSAVPGGLLVRIYGGTDWVFENAEVWGSRGTAGIHVDDGPQNSIGTWSLLNNCVHDTIPTDGTNQDHLLYINTTTGGTGLIQGNILFNSTNGRGIKLGPGDTGPGPTHVTVRYNTLYNNLGPSNIQVSGSASFITIDHNLMDLTNPNHQNITAADVFSGSNNIATNNAGWDSPGVVGAVSGQLTDGGGNVKLDPQFDSLTCSGFHPGNSLAQAYGKYASSL